MLSCDWLFFYRCRATTARRCGTCGFVLPSAVLTIPAALLAFGIVQRIHDKFKIDNGVV